MLGIGTSVVTFLVGRGMLPAGWTASPPSLEKLRAEAVHLVRTGRWLWVASVFAMLTANAEVLLLNRQAALPLVGAYALALNLATKADLVNSSLYTVLLPGVAGLRDRAAVASYVRRGFLRGGVIGLGLLLLIPVSEPLIVLIYGADFAQAAVFFRLLLGVMVFDVLLTPLLLLPLAYRQARLLAAADALRAITLVLVAMVTIPGLRRNRRDPRPLRRAGRRRCAGAGGAVARSAGARGPARRSARRFSLAAGRPAERRAIPEQ